MIRLIVEKPQSIGETIVELFLKKALKLCRNFFCKHWINYRNGNTIE